MEIKWFDSLDSTNSEVRREAETLPSLSVIVARDQYAGRGQRGNSWKVEPGCNLTFSLFLRPGTPPLAPLPAKRQFALTLLASSAVVNLLDYYGIESRIKWPNDIYVGDEKICGMLIENSIRGDLVEWSIIGIGINVNQTSFPPDLPNPTSMTLHSGEEYPIEDIMEDFTAAFKVSVSKNLDALFAQYHERLYRKGVPSNFKDSATGEIFKGTIMGVTPAGLLRVMTPSGEKHFTFKEIAYVI